MKNYFELTSAQRVGVAVWSAIIVLMIILLNINFSRGYPDPFEVSEADLKYVEVNANHSEQFYSDDFSGAWRQESAALFEFDPNTISATDWQNLGFSEKQAQVILNYREQNGPFKAKSDLKKIYIISDEKYAELEPYILLDDKLIKAQPDQIDLNAASPEQLESLPGIGEKYAQRIIKYRTALGGFVSVTQLHEVYGMTEETYQVLAENVVLTEVNLKRINLNTATKDEIDKHPYIDWPMTAEILKKRDQEKITSLDFLMEKNLLSAEKSDQLKPYIEF